MSCGRVVYQNPIPSVAAILMREGRVLLVRRNIDPGYGLWGLPGGFVELDETLEQAVTREVEEETGLLCEPSFIVGAQSVLGGYYGDLIVICYYARILGGNLQAGCDASEAADFSHTALPEMAFDIHTDFIRQFMTQAITSDFNRIH